MNSPNPPTPTPAPVTPEWMKAAAIEIEVESQHERWDGGFSGTTREDVLEVLQRLAPAPDALTASDWTRLRDWMRDPQRKPSSLAFTAGAARDAASAFESAAPDAGQDKLVEEATKAVLTLREAESRFDAMASAGVSGFTMIATGCEIAAENLEYALTAATRTAATGGGK